MSNPTLLVTGASGQLGRRVVELLLASGHTSLIATTRSPEKLAEFAARGVDVRRADFDDPASLGAAFRGADRLLLISTDVPGPGRIRQHQNAVQAAQAAGARHIVYTSIIHSGADSPAAVVPDHRATEAALEASAVGYTVLRENIYADLQLYALGNAIKSGQLFSAAGEGKTAYITREDVARASAAALAADFNGRRALNITGAEAVTQADLAALASKLSGQQVTYVPIPLEALIQGMVGAGLPRPVAELYASFDVATAAGEYSAVTGDFEALTGQKPTAISDFLTANQAAFAVPA